MEKIDDGAVELSFNHVLIGSVSRFVLGQGRPRGFNYLSKFTVSRSHNIEASGLA